MPMDTSCMDRLGRPKPAPGQLWSHLYLAEKKMLTTGFQRRMKSKKREESEVEIVAVGGIRASQETKFPGGAATLGENRTEETSRWKSKRSFFAAFSPTK